MNLPQDKIEEIAYWAEECGCHAENREDFLRYAEKILALVQDAIAAVDGEVGSASRMNAV